MRLLNDSFTVLDCRMFHHASPLYRHKDLSDQCQVLETSSAPITNKTSGQPGEGIKIDMIKYKNSNQLIKLILPVSLYFCRSFPTNKCYRTFAIYFALL